MSKETFILYIIIIFLVIALATSISFGIIQHHYMNVLQDQFDQATNGWSFALDQWRECLTRCAG